MYRYNGASVKTLDSDAFLFNQLNEIDLQQSVALVSPDADGNCGFRAVSLSVFGHQDGWAQVKKMLLNTLRSHSSIYRTYGLDLEAYDRKLNCAISPCLELSKQFMWYDTFGCPQLTADTFKRPVVLFSSSPKVFANNETEVDSNGSIVYNKHRVTFVPFFELDPQSISDPIVLFLTGSHFYLVERHVDVRKKKTIDFENWPKVNPLHKVIMREHGDICTSDFSDFYHTN